MCPLKGTPGQVETSRTLSPAASHVVTVALFPRSLEEPVSAEVPRDSPSCWGPGEALGHLTLCEMLAFQMHVLPALGHSIAARLPRACRDTGGAWRSVEEWVSFLHRVCWER